MPTPVAVLSGGTRGFELGMFKKGPVAQGFNFPLNTNYTWWNGVDILSTQYLIYTDKYTMGSSTLANTIPVAWSTPDLNDSSLLALINTLPPRVGLPGFTDLDAALNWMDGTGDFFLLKNGVENIVTSNLEVYYDPGLYTSYPGTGTAVSDLSGNNRTGTLINGTTYNSVGVASFNLDGSDDYLQSTNFTPNVTNKTLMGWCKLKDVTQQAGGVIGLMNTAGNVFDTIVYNETDQGWGFGSEGFARTSWSGFKETSNSDWVHICATYENNNYRLYRNGILIFTNTSYAALNFNYDCRVIMGKRHGSGVIGPLNAYIDMGMFYSRALSADEVLQNYNAQKDRFSIPSPIQNGLVLQLDAGNPLSYPRTGTVWTDISGFGNNGTLTNSPTFSANDGGYFQFDGADDYVNIGVNKSCNRFTGDFTVSAWVMRTGGASYGNIIGDYYTNSTANANEWQIMIGPGGQFNLYNVTGGYIIPNTSDFGTNVWLNVAVSRIGSSINMYVNGTYVSNGTSSTTFGSATGNLNIGVDGDGIAERLNGRISNVSIYKGVGLTAPQVVQNFNALAPRYGLGIVRDGLVLNYDAGNFASYPNDGTTFYDISGSMYDGTLMNGLSYSTTGYGSMNFDGTDDYVRTYQNAQQLGFYNANYTMEAWVYPTNLSGDRTMFGTDGSGLRQGLHLVFRSGSIYQGHFASDYEAGTVSVNNWYQIVYTYNASTGACQIYKNAVLQGTGSIQSFIGTTEVLIGRWISAQYFSGPGANYKIYNRVLTSDEITQNFNALRGRVGL